MGEKGELSKVEIRAAYLYQEAVRKGPYTMGTAICSGCPFMVLGCQVVCT